MHSLARSLKKSLWTALCLVLVYVASAATAWAFEVNRNAIVLLIAKDAQGEIVSTGTGFIVKPDGTLVTNYHVLVDAARVDAVFPNGTQVGVKGILNLDRTRDISILKLEDDLYSTLEIGDSTKLKPYDYLSAVGYPSQTVEAVAEGLEGTVLQTYGFVLGVHPQAFPDYSFIYATTPFEPGFSGGPVVNMDNQVVGIATLEGRALNLALPIHYAEPLLNDTQWMTFDTLRAQDQNAKEAYYFRGNFALYGLGDTNRAIDLFRKALEMDPKYVLARYDLAVAYRGLGQTERAISEYEKVLELNPKFPEALSNLGGQYFRKGEVDKAIICFRQALDIYPNFIQALSNLGAVLNKQEEFSQAVPYLKRALNLDPEFGVALFNLGNAYYGLGRWDDAVRAYHDAVNTGVDFLTLHWNLHDIHVKQGDEKQAMRELQIILQLDPQNDEARRKLDAMTSAP